jgi:hypothetical protein
MRAPRPVRTVTTALALGLLTSACGGQVGAGPAGSADCSTQIRADGVVFSSYGFTRHDATEHGVARESVCEDVGSHARGSVFTGESRHLTTYRIYGYPPSQVLGVRYPHLPRLAVFVADSVGHADRDRIYRELTGRLART